MYMMQSRRLRQKPRNLQLLLSLILLVLVMVAVGQKHVFAVTSIGAGTVDWNAIPSDIRCSLIQNDADRLKGPNDTCASADSSYCNGVGQPQILQLGYSWVYNPAQGSAADTAANPVPVTYGQAPSVNLDFQDMTFVCHQLTASGTILWGSAANLPNGYPGDAPANVPLKSASQMVSGTSGFIESASVSSSGNDGGESPVPGLVGQQYSQSYAGAGENGGTRYWFSNTIPFTFTGSGSWTDSGTKTLTLNIVQRPVNTFVDASGTTTYVCVFNGSGGEGVSGLDSSNNPYYFAAYIPGGQRDGANQYYATSGNAQTAYVKGTNYHCPDNSNAPTNYNIEFNVASAPTPIGHVDGGTCIANATGWALQQDSPNTSIPVDVYMDGPAGSGTGVGRFQTNVYRGDVNSAYSVTGNHGFSINLSAYNSPARSHTFYFYAIGQSPDGNALIGQLTIGPCTAASYCPAFTVGDPTHTPVTLSDQYGAPYGNNGAPYYLSSSEPIPPITYAGQTWYQDQSTGNYQIVSVSSDAAGGTTFSPTSMSSGPFSADYSQFITKYPYDPQVVTVTYNAQFTETVWTGKQHKDGTYYWTKASPKTVTYQETEISANTSDNGGDSTASFVTGNVDNVPECVDRTFSIAPQSDGSISFNNTENPTSLTYNSGNLQTTFGVAGIVPGEQGLHYPSKVKNINFSVTVKVYHANGTYSYTVSPGTPTGSGGLTTSGSAPNFTGEFASSSTMVDAATQQSEVTNPTVSVNYGVSMPPLQYGDYACATMTISPTTGNMKEPGQQTSSSGSWTTSSQVCSSNLAAKPFLKAYNGNLMTGSGFASGDSAANASDTQCTPGSNTPISTTAALDAYNNDGSPNWDGSGNELGIFSPASINGFASGAGQQVGGSTVGAPESLTFSNSSGGVYGGNFGTANCVPDYFNLLNNPSNVRPGVTVDNLDRSGSGTKHLPNSYTGPTVYLSSTGDVVINGPSSFPVNYPASWASGIGNIPLFYVVVKGHDIYIDHSITSMHGVYIAEPDSSGHGGNIYTCTNDTNTYPQNSYFDNCSSQLKVDGSLMAKKIYFNRTLGSVHNATGNQPSSPPPPPTVPPAPPVPDTTNWDYNGNASYWGFPGGVILTTTSTFQTGSAFYKTAIPSNTIKQIQFDEYTGSGSGADGLTLAFQDASAPGASATNVGSMGCGIGFQGMAGVAIALDTYQNAGDPSSNFMGVVNDSTAGSPGCVTYQSTDTAVPTIHNAFRMVTVKLDSNGAVTQICLDSNCSSLATPVQLPPNVYVGFTGSTGGATDYHLVYGENFTMQAPPAGAAASALPNCSRSDPQAAEVVCYTPDAWLTSPFVPPVTDNAVATLPPVL